ncbi:NADH:flavin oxidoreductase/NADH oxidase [Orrella sp. 11846]|uniref:NADH:flavin oxidoreductase/NADH oxidase n=1 Tax=Orrella sp. 11846 TaxID=3409913 RepID=UPI003B5A2FFD
MTSQIGLFTPLTLRSVTFKNRIVVAPMCQYSAIDGEVNDWHLVHLGRFAAGGAGAVMVEATAVVPQGRITHGDLGLWCDQQIEGLARIAAFVKSQGSVPMIQLAHAGRKASMQRPWHGHGPMSEEDLARGEEPWAIEAPSELPVAPGWLEPKSLTHEEMGQLREAWCDAAKRSLQAGFEAIEVHAAHGYLLHSFLSPISNQRNDEYGGDFEGRSRFVLEVVEAVRAVWPEDKPLFVRLSCVDGVEGGLTLEDSVRLAHRLKALGVDVVDCSSGGLSESATATMTPRGLGHQVPYAQTIRRDVEIATMAVGLILFPEQAQAIVQEGQADLVALGRELMFNPNWPDHAQLVLQGETAYEDWPHQAGWWLQRRAKMLGKLGVQSVVPHMPSDKV